MPLGEPDPLCTDESPDSGRSPLAHTGHEEIEDRIKGLAAFLDTEHEAAEREPMPTPNQHRRSVTSKRGCPHAWPRGSSEFGSCGLVGPVRILTLHFGWVAPVPGGVRPGAAGILPLGGARQPIVHPGAPGQPRDAGRGVVPTDTYRGMTPGPGERKVAPVPPGALLCTPDSPPTTTALAQARRGCGCSPTILRTTRRQRGATPSSQ